MTQEQLIAEVVRRTGETAETVTPFVNIAGEALLNHIYPFHDTTGKSVPARYQQRQIEIAVYLVNKRGAEGETKHNENGIDRTYEGAEIPASYYEGIVPHAFIPMEEEDEDA